MKYVIRVRQNNKHLYLTPNGKNADHNIVQYVKSLHIPPAYPLSVIFLEYNNILAVSYDEMGRKQYKYTKDFSENNSKIKFEKLIDTIDGIQSLKNRTSRDINEKDIHIHNKETAIIARILLECYLRVGSRSGVKKYQHYGISTIEKRHLEFDGNICIINFIGKKGIENSCILRDPITINALKKLYSIAKTNHSMIFQYATNVNVNIYLQDVNPNISTKTLRTYGANYILLKSLKNIDIENLPKSERQKIMILNQHIDKVSSKLQNTRNVLKTNYLLPKITEWFMKNPEIFIQSLKHHTIHNFMKKLCK
jgi:DNA topoisomerase-1